MTLNLEIRFDENLRDYAVAPDDIKKAIIQLEEELTQTSQPLEQIKILGQIGTYQRVLGLLDQALQSFEKAISLAQYISQKKLKLVNLIRLGHTKHWMKKYSEAHRIFEDCFDMISKDVSLNEYLDFVFQHRGKCFLDENNFESAHQDFNEALVLRKVKGTPDLIESTVLALDLVEKRIK